MKKKIRDILDDRQVTEDLSVCIIGNYSGSRKQQQQQWQPQPPQHQWPLEWQPQQQQQWQPQQPQHQWPLEWQPQQQQLQLK